MAEKTEAAVLVETATNAPKEKVSNLFAWSHATSVSGTAMLIAAIIGSYFSVYMTDTMMIPAAAASMIMFVATLWDAINDPMMGVIADRTKSKWGRYRPYFVVAPILLTIFGTLIWLNPDFSTNGKIIYVLLTYIGYGMTVTMYTMPQMAILPAHVKTDDQRNKVIMMGAGATAVMFTIGASFTPQMRAFFEGAFGISNGYIPLMIVLGLISCISFWSLFATAKEKYIAPVSDTPLTQDLKKILRHKELSPFVVVWIMASMGYGLMFASSVFYVMYYLGRPDLISIYMLVVSMGALVSMVVLMPICMRIFKTAQRTLLVTQIAAIICYVTLFFVGNKSMMLLYVITFIATSVASMSNALVNVLVNDAIDYIQFKDGITANGVISSIKGFAQKCGNTVTNSGILAVLAWAGYRAGEIGNQPESTMFAINFLRFGAPALISGILLIALKFNPVEKHRADILEMKELIRDHSEDNHDA